ncbi:alpha/beta hydrolase [[Limnothrix rosea] IAM M-220]|uniref:alpha/beta hydrolase n=1 Tax=[Limnothrix rosea] IAM M-220 TaxID=454133 RepID=UPI000968791F|nr:alpha/beta fold hydrolase [[Limnothrix rosea] IAM M-220]OKH11246.1 hypothetical protein NIES208_17570 [[Limnothrix rosea] IAM M-220]
MPFFVWFCLCCILIYLGICLVLWVVQRRIIFEPQCQPVTPIPDNLAIAYETEKLKVGEKNTEEIVTWWFPCDDAKGKTVLLLHGNGGYEMGNFQTLEILHQSGFNVLMVNYRGYGESSNIFPNEQRVYEDAATAYEFLRQQKHILPKDLLIYGHSLGGAIAVELATRYECAGLFLESTFASMLEMSITKTYMQFFPINWILQQRFDTRQKIPLLKLPIFLCHGTADETVPSFMSERLMAIANQPKRLEIIDGADHHNLAQVGANTIKEGIQWLKTLQSADKAAT